MANGEETVTVSLSEKRPGMVSCRLLGGEAEVNTALERRDESCRKKGDECHNCLQAEA
jgi:hypothetical protein